MSWQDEIRIGSIVGCPIVGDDVRRAEVVEDRGNLGPGGERVLRIQLLWPGNDHETEIEVLVSQLVPWPPPEPASNRPRRRAAHRRPARA